MKALVIYESMYGNTHEIAEAIAEGLERVGEIELASVTQISPESVGDRDLLVVGGPTHMHGMSRAGSRRAAAEAAEKDDELKMDPDASGPGLREWLDDLPKTSTGGVGAAFDTRLDKSALLVGSAAKGITKLLRRHGYGALADPESFFIEDSGHHLKDGELERARRWGGRLAERCEERSVRV